MKKWKWIVDLVLSIAATATLVLGIVNLVRSNRNQKEFLDRHGFESMKEAEQWLEEYKRTRTGGRII